ncbi:hypothetical protein H1R17_03770 [Flavobacterium sp. xlx-214]|uniref:hypothetical protein n=1 Tax=unclassified Flavobacterium TaxID=196869 RepID=UPI0013D7E1EE|nr:MULTISPECIES: hypothetical protein [unclassified Flavobacterium]MBA5792009.1 hypothetical protein [Flavobacterium sp. xlx-221]QMI84263.1 hypothetical protein H1R17_03770 [Flavobacterium sp. xlx-214]
MKKTIKIHIPKPCEKQEWSSELISNKEKMCLLCSEKVFDATSLTDDELHQLVTSKTKPKCIQLKQSQLNRPITVSSHQYKYKQLQNAFYGLLVAGLVVSCSVQKQPEKAIADYEQLFQTDPFFNDTLKDVIRGIVINYENKPIPRAFVSVKGSSKGVKTDEKGYFKYEIPHYVLSDTMTLKIQAVYWQERYNDEFIIIKNNLPLNSSFMIIDQEIEDIVVGIYRTFD